MRKSVVLTVLAASLIASAPVSTVPAAKAAEELRSKGSVSRDAYGIPTIKAASDKELFERLGYSVAEDRLFQLELIRRNARGTLAEVFGPAYVEADKLKRITGYTEEEYRSIWKELKPGTREVITAYVDGINRRIREVQASPDKLLPYEFRKLNAQPQEWNVNDSLAATTNLFRTFGGGGGTELSKLKELEQLTAEYGQTEAWKLFNDRYWKYDPDAPSYLGEPAPGNGRSRAAEPKESQRPSHLDSEDLTPFRQYEELTDRAQIVLEPLGFKAKPTLASFAWVLSGQKTASGHPVLSGSPQMGYDFPGIVYETHLQGGSGFDVAGFHPIGQPIIPVGYTPDAAYSVMVGTGDTIDIYQEELNPANRSEYRYNGRWKPFEQRQETIRVAGAAPQTVTVYRSIHGPVVAPTPFNPADPAKYAYTRKSSHWLQEPKSIDGLLGAMKAKDVLDVLSNYKDVCASLHVVAADSQDNIGYIHTGLVPVRPANVDFRLPAKGDGTQEWTGSFQEFPGAINPEKGYVTGWNNKALPEDTSTDGRFFGKYSRALWLERALGSVRKADSEFSRNLLRAQGSIVGTAASLTEAGAYAADFLPYINQALSRVPANTPDLPALKQAAKLLAEWNGLAVNDPAKDTVLKPQQAIYDRWLESILNRTFNDEYKNLVSFYSYSKIEDDRINMLIHALEGKRSPVPVSRNYFDDITTKDKVETADDIIVASLRDATTQLTKEFGTSDPTQWTLKRPVTDIKHPLLGKIGEFPAQTAGTYSFYVDFKQEGRGGKTTLYGSSRWPYGSSAWIGTQADGKPSLANPHLLDMQELYNKFQYQPIKESTRPSTGGRSVNTSETDARAAEDNTE